MKTQLPDKITTIAGAKGLLTNLWQNKESFHPEDDATQLSGDPFTMEEGKHLNQLMCDIYALPECVGDAPTFDPCDYLMLLDKKFLYKDLSGRDVTCKHNGAQLFDTVDIFVHEELQQDFIDYLHSSDLGSEFTTHNSKFIRL